MKHHHHVIHCLETMKMKDGQVELLQLHKQRLQEACRHFKIEYKDDIDQLLADKKGDWKIRLLKSQTETIVEFLPLPENDITVVTVDSIHTDTNEFTKYKTSHRIQYTHANERHPAYDDVILWDSNDFVLETTIANLVFELNGQWFTPDLSLGQLKGVYLTWLMTTREIFEAKILYTDLHKYKIYCCNAVRGLYPVTLE